MQNYQLIFGNAMHLPSNCVLVLFLHLDFRVSSHIMHEESNQENDQGKPVALLDDQTLLHIRIGLKQQNLHLGPGWLHQISHPDNYD